MFDKIFPSLHFWVCSLGRKGAQKHKERLYPRREFQSHTQCTYAREWACFNCKSDDWAPH